jgi:hypothetical protein
MVRLDESYRWDQFKGGLAEAVWNWQERFGRLKLWLSLEWWYWKELGRDITGLYGRKKPESHTFTWWTYYVATSRSLRYARLAKRQWGRGYIAADTCCVVYERYEGVQKRALERGYVKMASTSIHSKG